MSEDIEKKVAESTKFYRECEWNAKELNSLPCNGDRHSSMSETDFGVGGLFSAGDVSSSTIYSPATHDLYRRRTNLFDALPLARRLQNMYIGDSNGVSSDQFGTGPHEIWTPDPRTVPGYFQGRPCNGGCAPSSPYDALAWTLGRGGNKIGGPVESYFDTQDSLLNPLTDRGAVIPHVPEPCGDGSLSSQLCYHKHLYAISVGNMNSDHLIHPDLRANGGNLARNPYSKDIMLHKHGLNMENAPSLKNQWKHAFVMPRPRSESCTSGTSMQTTLCENGRSLLSYNQALVQQTHESLAEVRGNIRSMAKDQQGCRILQNKLVGGSREDKMIIFGEIIDHVVEIMVDQFGNYLIQKLLDVCDECQRLSIVHKITRVPGELVRISLNTHGTRVVQRLIATLKTRKQISLVKQELESGFLNLIKDSNGNHVVAQCLDCFSNDDNKFIFDAATKLCVEIGTHEHGCCFIQKCIAQSKGEHRQNLITAISANALCLAEDRFGNYVVQCIIQLNTPTAAANLMSQFEGHFVRLSVQKFSSHVVEKCIKCFEEYRPMIIQELLLVPHFEQLVQDQYANYVVQSALVHTKGHLLDALVAAIKPHYVCLHTHPNCKKIFSHKLLRQ